LPRWPQGKAHRDEHFGDVVVYFDQAEVTLPLLRDKPDPAHVTLVATFQGCQTDGICYPPMTRRVALDVPAGMVSPQNQAQAAPLMMPQGKAHRDEHFGDVVVYFDQAEVTLPLLRDKPDPAHVTLVATFQGCQTDGICYPPMTRRVALDVPAGMVSPQNQAQAAPLM
ncbi:hypothetical protein FQJ95_25315, partial [Xanthomonas vasicola]